MTGEQHRGRAASGPLLNRATRLPFRHCAHYPYYPTNEVFLAPPFPRCPSPGSRPSFWKRTSRKRAVCASEHSDTLSFCPFHRISGTDASPTCRSRNSARTNGRAPPTRIWDTGCVARSESLASARVPLEADVFAWEPSSVLRGCHLKRAGYLSGFSKRRFKAPGLFRAADSHPMLMRPKLRNVVDRGQCGAR
jgi:hypothetical protein